MGINTLLSGQMYTVDRFLSHLASFVETLSHHIPFSISSRLVGMRRKKRKLVGKDRLVTVKKVEGDILDGRVVQGPVSKDHVWYKLVPIALILVDVHSQQVQEGLVETLCDASRLGSISRAEDMSCHEELSDGFDQGIMEMWAPVR